MCDAEGFEINHQRSCSTQTRPGNELLTKGVDRFTSTRSGVRVECPRCSKVSNGS